MPQATRIPDFETEIYFGRYEFTKPYMLSSSDCETVTMKQLAEYAGADPRDLEKMRFGYTESAGAPELRALIAEDSQASPEQVVVLGSPVEGIYITLRTLLSPGDHVVVLTPAYDGLLNLAEHVTANASRWDLIDEGDRWSLDWDALDRIVSAKTRLMVLNFPHNPTGFIPSRKDLDRLVALAEKFGFWIFSDEMYRGLEYRAEERLPVFSTIYDKSIVLGGVSKSYGLPGMRLGWLVAPDAAVRERLINTKFYTSMCPSVMAETFGVWALRARDRLRGDNVTLIKKNLETAERMFSKKPEFRWLRPQAGSVSLAEYLPGGAEAFCHRLAEEKGIVLLPARFMGIADRFVRFGFGRKNFAEVAQRFGSKG